jgi:hypothetical protein
MNDSTKGEGV